MFAFTEKQINIFLFMVSVVFFICSVGAIKNYGTMDFFSHIFQAIISLQIISVFYGVKIKNHNFGNKAIAKYLSLSLLLVSGFILASFLLSVNSFGFGGPMLLYQILSPILILFILIIVIPIHVKLIRRSL